MKQAPLSVNRKFHRVIAAAAMGLSLVATASAAVAQAAKDVGAFTGLWKINPALTKMGRFGPNGKNIARGPNFTWAFTPIDGGLKMDVFYDYPQAKPTRTMSVLPDEKPHPCDSGGAPCLTTGGNPKDQTYRYYSINPHMLVRLFFNKDEVQEYGTYAVSTDGKRLTIISWDPATPEWQNIQIFDKQP